MENSKLDFKYFHPEVFQAVAGKNYVVYAYMNDGSIRMLDMKPIIKNGGIFAVLENEKTFCEKLTVLNYSVAWDIDGKRDESNCIDIDPFHIFNSPIISNIPELEDVRENRIPLAWDPDFTKVTSSERAELEQAVQEIENGEIVPHEAINWD